MSIILPQLFQRVCIRLTIIYHKSVVSGIKFTRIDLPVSILGRRITKKWLSRVNTHGLRRAEILRMIHNGNASHTAVYFTPNVAPSGFGGMPFFAVFAFRSQECSIFSAIPLAV